MKSTIRNPIPWSVARNHDGSYDVTITAGPREAIKLIFPSLLHFGVFSDILQSAAASVLRKTDGHGGTGLRWESPALAAVRGRKLGPPPDPETMTHSILQEAGFTYDPKSGAWDFHKEALERFSYPGRFRK